MKSTELIKITDQVNTLVKKMGQRMTIDEIKGKYAQMAATAPSVGDADKAQRMSAAKSLKAIIPVLTKSMNDFVSKLENGRVLAKTANPLISKLTTIGRTMDSFH